MTKNDDPRRAPGAKAQAINVLADLNLYKQWVGYNADKKPLNPRGGYAEADNPSTWGTRAEADKRGKGKVGIEFGPIIGRDDLCLAGVDLDGCRDLDTKAVAPWAKEAIAKLGTYTELSPSGKGLHALFFYRPSDLAAIEAATPSGTGGQWKPEAGIGIEFYFRGRYFTVTDQQFGPWSGLKILGSESVKWIVSAGDKLMAGNVSEFPKERTKKFDEAATLRDLMSGASYHPAAISLGGYWARTGVSIVDAFARLKAAFEVTDEGDRDDRWKARFKQIPEILQYAYGKEAADVAGIVDGFDTLDDDDPIGGMGGTPTPKHSTLITQNLGDVDPEAVEWIWLGRVARGEMTLLGGDPGLGKSQISLDVAARITTGAAWPEPNAGEAPLGSVVILSGEDAPAHTIVPRLIAAGANLSKVEHVKSAIGVNDKSRGFNLQQDLYALGEIVTKLEDVVLVILDPITAYMGENLDSHKATDVRRVLERVAEWAKHFNVAVIAITHPPKATQGKAVNSFIGSAAYAQHCRITYSVMEEQDTKRPLLLPVKVNLTKPASEGGPRGLGYKLVSVDVPAKDNKTAYVSKVEWDGEPVDTTADEILDARKHGPKATGAEHWLRGVLGFGGEMVAGEIEAKAAAAGYSKSVLGRAKIKLGVKAEKKGFGKTGVWMWSLPVEPEPILQPDTQLNGENLI